MNHEKSTTTITNFDVSCKFPGNQLQANRGRYGEI